jgi:hypothetical protein
MGPAAVLNLPLGQRPVLSLTDDEASAIFKASASATLKILKYEAAVNGDDATLRAAVQQHMDYEKSLFSTPEKKK